MDSDENQPLLLNVAPHYDMLQGPQFSAAMENPPIGVSQQHLVDDIRDEQTGKKLPQFIAALCATLGALATGSVLGWSSPAVDGLKDKYTDIVISDGQFSWISALATLGSACVCIPIGFVMDSIGRKITMLILVIPFTVGWILLVTATNVAMLYAGRFIVGIAGGAFCVTAPTYTSEIAETSVRGTLGSFFQLMVTIGILFSYVLGSYVDFFVFNILCLLIPLIFGILFFFMPETPNFYLSKGKRGDALKSIIWLRGQQYDAESELDTIQAQLDATKNNNMSVVETFTQKSVLKTIIICFTIMFFQQFSGINAVLFNVASIFEASNTEMEKEVSSIIIGAIQVVATLLSTIVVDKLGRKILLIFSGAVMCLCGVALGVFFYLKDDEELASTLSWLPLTSLCIFITAFSLGYGPIPWMLAGELCTSETKSIISSTAGTFNWILAFIITFTFQSMTDSMGEYGTFWFFASIMAVSVLFVIIFVFETKGKTSEEIQSLLGATTVHNITPHEKSNQTV